MSKSRILYPSTKTSRYYLFEIDRKKKTAYCSACGWTEIHIQKNHIRKEPKIFCVKRFQQLQADQAEKQRLRASYKPRHLLSEVDIEKLTAVCAVCGPTDIWRHSVKGSVKYTCATHGRNLERKSHRNSYTSKTTKPRAHALSQIDEEKKIAVCSKCGPVTIYIWQGKNKVGRRCSNVTVARIPGALEIRREINTDAINRFKIVNGCRACGYKSNLLLLTIYSTTGRKSPANIKKLLKLSSSELTQKLAECEVFCGDCR